MKKNNKKLILFIFMISIVILVLWGGYEHKNKIEKKLNIFYTNIETKIVEYVDTYVGVDYVSTGGKTINCLGDSITEGYKNREISWADKIEPLVRTEKINKYGIGGSTVSDYVDEHPMCIRYSEMDDSADFIVIFAGNNDFTRSVPMGEPNDTNTKTFYGALNTLLSGLREKYPNGKFLYVTPLRMWNYAHPKWNEFVEYDKKNKVGKTLKDYRDAIISRCEYYEIPYLDLYNEGLYGRTEKTRNAVYIDGLHPNDEGHNIIASKIAGKLKMQ